MCTCDYVATMMTLGVFRYLKKERFRDTRPSGELLVLLWVRHAPYTFRHPIYIHRLVPLWLKNEPLYPPASEDRCIAARTFFAASSGDMGLYPGAYCSNFGPYFSSWAISSLVTAKLLNLSLYLLQLFNSQVVPGSVVSIRPGQIDAKRIPWCAYAAANFAVNVARAALLTA